MRAVSPLPRWTLAVLACAGLRPHDAQAHELLRLDAGNTQITFTVRRIGMRVLVAGFDDLSGSVLIDPAGGASRVDVSVRMASLHCEHACDLLRSAQWLDVQHYPLMQFHSTQMQLADGGRAMIYGQLTLHGITHAVELRTEHWNCAAQAGARHCSFESTARIRRSDFGLPHGFWAGGDEVDILIRGADVPAEPLPAAAAR